MTPDYLLLGHLTRDLLPDGTFAPGGTALYAALAAQRLGARTALVSAGAALPPDWPPAIEQAQIPGTTPIFENRYSPAGRSQILHADATPIRLEDVPLAWRDAPLVHLGPVLGETPEALAHAFPQALLGVTPQGWMRSWQTPLPGPVAYRPWQPEPRLLRTVGALVLSIEDVRGDEALVRSYAQHCRLVALTRGAQGATLYLDGAPHSIPAFPAIEHDPTGAGDVFAAALLLRLRETSDPLAAARFAACAAALSIAGPGHSRIPDRAAVEGALQNA
ncbi:MAG: PfkB family carbohydrate kinase [Roseiflexaceae bacterium]